MVRGDNPAYYNAAALQDLLKNNWGDGSSSSGSTPSQGTISASHTYLLLGSYTITVRVTDSHGASGSDKKLVRFVL